MLCVHSALVQCVLFVGEAQWFDDWSMAFNSRAYLEDCNKMHHLNCIISFLASIIMCYHLDTHKSVSS